MVVCGIPCELRFAGSRPLTLREGDVLPSLPLWMDVPSAEVPAFAGMTGGVCPRCVSLGGFIVVFAG